MKMIFKAFAKKLFGAKYERLTRTIFIYLIVFWGLYIADFRVQIAPFILYLMVSTFTVGVMWQALSSKDNAANMQNIFMLPFDNRKFVFSYVAALGTYTFFTKTLALLAVLLAVSVWQPIEILGSIICAINAILMTAAIYSLKKYWYVGILWGAALIIAIFSWENPSGIISILIVNSTFSAMLLQFSDVYTFYLHQNENSHITKEHKHHSVWRYLFRYLEYHKNYLINTVFMWCVACVLPLLFKQMDSFFVVPIGFAILSLNTPICIMLSSDPALEQAIRFLPDQKKEFCIPYCLFIFLFNMVSDVFFLCSWGIQNGNITIWMIFMAIFFALQSAVFSVLLEWFYPIRDWKIESDLWHHPRKYIVPVLMMLLAGAFGLLPFLMPILSVSLVAEIVVLFFRCRR